VRDHNKVTFALSQVISLRRSNLKASQKLYKSSSYLRTRRRLFSLLPKNLTTKKNI
jgi:hypothetical protein